MSKIVHNFLIENTPVVSFNINQGSPLSEVEVKELDTKSSIYENTRIASRKDEVLIDPTTGEPNTPNSIDEQLFRFNPNTKLFESIGSQSPKQLRGLEKEFAPSDAGIIGDKERQEPRKTYPGPITLPPKDGVNKRTKKTMKNKKGPPVKIFKLAGDSEACIEIGKDFVRIKAGDGSFFIINKSSINAGSAKMNWQMSPEQITYHGLLNQVNPIMGMFPIAPKYLITAGPIIALANAFRANALIASAVGIVV